MAAGLGLMGIHRHVIHQKLGNFISMGTILEDAEVSLCSQSINYHPCLECKLCLAACPVGAISSAIADALYFGGRNDLMSVSKGQLEYEMSHKFFDLTFTPSMKAAQERYGSRRSYSRFEGGEPDFYGLGEAENDVIAQRDGFYLSTVNASGQPYVQFRGGPAGFLKVLDKETLGFADFRGNSQYISTGNMAENGRAALFLMDYPNQTRLKILARSEVNDAKDVPELIAKLAVRNYKATIERAMILHVDAFDWNCQQHITPRYTIEEIRELNSPLYEHIAKLEPEVERLKQSNNL